MNDIRSSRTSISASPSQSEAPASTREARYPLTEDTITPISVVSHSRLLRDSLVTLFAPYLLVRLVGSYSGHAQPNENMPDPQCHIILIDSGIGYDMTQLWTKWWRSRPSPVPVIVLEVEDNKDAILSYIEIGISGYTLKEAPPAEVAQAIYLAGQGLAQCSQKITACLFERLASLRSTPPAAIASPKPLTTREMDVLRCIAQGMSNKEIAASLVIEVYTVKHHVHNILEKMNLRHRYEAGRFATEQGLVSE